MKQQILSLNSKRKYQETQSNLSKLTFNDDFENVKKKQKNQETINTQYCLFTLGNQDCEIGLQFEDLINQDFNYCYGQEYGVELFDEIGETVMDINSEQQLNSLLLNQKHLSIEQKMVAQQVFFEKLDENKSISDSEKFFKQQNMQSDLKTLTQDETSENQNYFQYLEQNEQIYSYKFDKENIYQSEIDTSQCQDSQIQILEIGYLAADEFNQSYQLEESYQSRSSYQIDIENLFIQTQQQNQETLLFKNKAYLASKSSYQKAKPQSLQNKKIRKRQVIKSKQGNIKQKIFFKLVQQIPSQLSKIKMHNQKGIQNPIAKRLLQQIKQLQTLQMLESLIKI
ncbi:hypothetical protein TTHERM_00471000 (macronuclear) [Tetrahymena thermophila SB210]|uniref:Uncharacterized protein n=1 Tax=Tetrahymena thermophila (strain SB210) TaxID=312017 RepID=I7M6J6_TETTS|nr:hypothetical protein TTHERM_00471000 [Tetrahymena thermophila SB210]EAR85327.2 hypothetical protein TTHERM_00471000 [Tetrahymena thermophila SB210]|eukprot:XP_001032990.2 hypothetical protein TTHERM_00471000 [Tetrahymena thermophila SB210]